MMKRMKRFSLKQNLLCLLAVCLLLCFTQMTALAEEGQTIYVSNETALIEALNQTSPVAQIHIMNSFTVTGDCSVLFDPTHLACYSNVVVTIDNGVTLTVENGGIIGCYWPSFAGSWSDPVTPNGRMVNNGTIIVKNGGSIRADFDCNNGSIVVESGGEAVCCSNNNGTVTVYPGGSYRTTQGGSANNHGTIEIQHGAQMESRFGSRIINCSDGILTLNGDFYCGAMNDGHGKEGVWFENSGTVSGSGSVILYDVRPENPVDLDAMIANMMGQLGQTTRFDNWDDIGIYKKVEVSSYSDLATAFPGDRIVAGEDVEGDMDVIAVLTGNITIPSQGEIATMGRIIIPNGSALTVSNGGALEAGIENNGNITVESGGKLATTMGGSVINNGTMTINHGAELRSQMGGSVVNRASAALTLNGDFYCGAINDGHGKEGVWFENSGTVSGSGSVILYDARPENPVDLDAMVTEMGNTIGASGGITVTPSYTVTWMSQDGSSTLETDSALNGTAPEFNGTTPTKNSDANYTYSFNGWATSPNQESGTEEKYLSAVSGPVTYYAAFSKTARGTTASHSLSEAGLTLTITLSDPAAASRILVAEYGEGSKLEKCQITEISSSNEYVFTLDSAASGVKYFILGSNYTPISPAGVAR